MKTALCHPDRKHIAKGFCGACYYQNVRKVDPAAVERDRLYAQRYRLETSNDPEALLACRAYDKSYAERRDYRAEYVRRRARRLAARGLAVP